MLKKWFSKTAVQDEQFTPKYPLVLTANELLSQKYRCVLLTKIKRSFSVTEEVWDLHYLHAIEQFAELVQGLPASEIHHHSEHGGLLDHTLEALYAGVRIAQGYVLPPNAEPEHIASSTDRWRFGVFIAILAHDLGKVVTDHEVVFRQRGGEFAHWHPWFGNLPIGAEYTFRYKARSSDQKVTKSLHEKAAISLLPKLLTREATNWIFEDPELLSQILSTISHSTFGGLAIAEIVRKADGSSVAENLGAETGVNSGYSQSTPLHEKLIVALRKLIADGELKMNKPGAALWVSEDETWLVSKAGMEAVRSQLLNEGHKGIPKNVVRMFEVLNDHELIVKNPQGDSVWVAEINDLSRNWQQKLTFLRFKNQVLWPTKTPDEFDGTVIPIDKDENPISKDVPLEKPEPPLSIKQEVEDECQQSREAEAPLRNQLETKPVTSNIEIKAHDAQEGKVSNEQALQNEFIHWLLNGVQKRKIRVNEPKALVHILENHIALVTPAIFVEYLDKNSLKKSLYAARSEGNKPYTALQKEVESLGINLKSRGGQNIHTVHVEGQRTRSNLKAYLLDRRLFPSLANFSPNPAIKIEL